MEWNGAPYEGWYCHLTKKSKRHWDWNWGQQRNSRLTRSSSSPPPSQPNWDLGIQLHQLSHHFLLTVISQPSSSHNSKPKSNPPVFSTTLHHSFWNLHILESRWGRFMKTHEGMLQQKNQRSFVADPFTLLSDEIIFSILDFLGHDPFSRKSFSLVCKSFFSIESRHRKTLKPLSSDFLRCILLRYPVIDHLDLSLCPVNEADSWDVISSLCNSALRSVKLSPSMFFANAGFSKLVMNCSALIEIDLSNVTEFTDSGAVAIAEAKNLKRLWLVRCKLVSDIGIGCIAVGCRKLRLINLKWCLRVSDLGVGLIALKCKEIRCLDLSYLPASLIFSISLFSFFFSSLLPLRKKAGKAKSLEFWIRMKKRKSGIIIIKQLITIKYAENFVPGSLIIGVSKILHVFFPVSYIFPSQSENLLVETFSCWFDLMHWSLG